jgi:hypothetical protein
VSADELVAGKARQTIEILATFWTIQRVVSMVSPGA